MSQMFYDSIVDRLSMRINKELRSGQIVPVYYYNDDTIQEIVSYWFGSCSHISGMELTYNYHYYSIVEYCLFSMLRQNFWVSDNYCIFNNIVTMVNAIMNIVDMMVRDNVIVDTTLIEEVRILSSSLFNSSLFEPSDNFNNQVKDFFSCYCENRPVMSMNLILQTLNIPIIE